MKKILSILTFLLVLPITCRADFNVNSWQYYKEIVNSSAGLVRVSLDDEIFSGSKNNLRDLRVIDSGNKEIPIKVVSGKINSAKTSFAPEMINNSFAPGQFSTVILDLGEAGRITNNLLIETFSENFQRNVKVYGGDDISNWNVLKNNAYIYDYTDRKGNFKSRDTVVTFPDSVFRYIKIEIADDNNMPVVISSVLVSQNINAAQREFERQPNFAVAENNQNKTTEIIVDLGSNGIPASKFIISTEGINFNRGVIVNSSYDRNAWKFVNQGYIFRYATAKFTGENMVINFPETNERYLKIEIINKDNEPIAIKGVRIFSVFRDVVFQSEAGKKYKIFYGNPKANYPEYDLDKYFQYLDVDAAEISSLSPQTANQNYVAEKEPAKPLSERMPFLFPGVLILTSLILLFLVYKFLQKNKPSFA